jgi:energy-coupling factor transporter ATP-binding protein EcfA2
VLIQFGVENFGSIDGEQTLSLVASNYYHDNENNVIDPGLPGLSGVRLLRGAALYGPNGSGKSTVIRAMGVLQMLVVGARGPEVALPYDPFCLEPARRNEPTKFFVSFVQDHVRYEYELQYLPARVLFESLSAYPHGRERLWFSRRWDADANRYEWNRPAGNLKASSQLTKMVRDNALMLSVGAQLNNPQLAEVHRWFAGSLKVLSLSAESNPPLDPRFSAELLKSKSPLSPRLIDLVRHADLGVVDVSVEPVEPPPEMLEQLSVVVQPELLAQIAASSVKISFDHQGGDNIVPIDSSSESAGTQRLFALAGPWLDILENGHTAFIDELDASLHPLLLKELLRLMFSPKTNPKGAQVVFTTHNPYLLAGSVLRRDQVWFTEKDAGGGTHLYPLSDYRPRTKESRINGYLAGRYGAVPMIPAGLGLQ